MTRFRTLSEFEKRSEKMNLEELRSWESYWRKHAQRLNSKVEKEAMKRVHEIQQAIARKEKE